jgi:hypothetical protein
MPCHYSSVEGPGVSVGGLSQRDQQMAGLPPTEKQTPNHLLPTSRPLTPAIEEAGRMTDAQALEE